MKFNNNIVEYRLGIKSLRGLRGVFGKMVFDDSPKTYESIFNVLTSRQQTVHSYRRVVNNLSAAGQLSSSDGL